MGEGAKDMEARLDQLDATIDALLEEVQGLPDLSRETRPQEDLTILQAIAQQQADRAKERYRGGDVEAERVFVARISGVAEGDMIGEPDPHAENWFFRAASELFHRIGISPGDALAIERQQDDELRRREARLQSYIDAGLTKAQRIAAERDYQRRREERED